MSSNSDPNTNVLHPISAVAERLSLHRITVYGLCSRGELKATKIGRAVRVSDRELDRFIDAHTAGQEAR